MDHGDGYAVLAGVAIEELRGAVKGIDDPESAASLFTTENRVQGLLCDYARLLVNLFNYSNEEALQL